MVLTALRSIIKFCCFFAIFHTVNALFKRFTEKYNEENLSGWTFAIVVFVALSVAWVFYHYNSLAKKHFVESFALNGNSGRMKSGLSVLGSSDFLIDTVICFVLSLLGSYVWGYDDLENLFFPNINFFHPVRGLLIGLFVGFVFFFVNWFTIYDVRKKWRRNKEVSSKYEILIIIAYLFFITVMYTVGFYIAMSYVPGIPTYVFLFKEFFWYIVIILVFFFVLVNFNRINKRKKFISKLKKLAVASNFELSAIEKPYLSIFKKTSDASFTITAYQKSYQCKLISGKRKNISIIFSDQGFLLFRRVIRIGKTELFSIYSKYNYSFESNMKKCLIITCIPTNCYFKDSSGQMRKIDTGEKIGEYTVFSSSGFLGALERDCLDR